MRVVLARTVPSLHAYLSQDKMFVLMNGKSGGLGVGIWEWEIGSGEPLASPSTFI